MVGGDDSKMGCVEGVCVCVCMSTIVGISRDVVCQRLNSESLKERERGHNDNNNNNSAG